MTDPKPDDLLKDVALMRAIVEAPGNPPTTMIMADDVIRAFGGEPSDYPEIMPGVRLIRREVADA